VTIRVLGFNVSHDSSACLVEDGVISSALALERVTRVKRGTVPHHRYAGAMAELTREILASNGLDVADVDWWIATSTESRDEAEEARLLSLLGLVVPPERCLQLPHPGHHLAHASAGFYSSGFDEAAALVIDAYGSLVGSAREQETILHFTAGAEPRTVHRILRNSERAAGYPRDGELWLPAELSGVGEVYRVVTLALGFREHGTIYDDAGKTMGLASYGKRFSDEPLFIRTTPDGLRFDGAADSLVELGLAVREGDELRLTGRRAETPFEQAHYNLASQIQEEFEEACLYLARQAVAATGCRSLVTAGGAFLNSSVNTLLLREAGIDRLFVFPASTDDGNAAGAALYAYHRMAGSVAVGEPLRHVYLGPPRISGRDVAALADRWGLPVRQHPGPEQTAEAAAAALVRGEIVGWYQDRAEFGPRALGARSILCHPGIPGMKERLNARVKFREAFRPFAGSVLAENAAEWFEMPTAESPFMLLVCPVRPHQQTRVSEIVHVDGTCRLQTVAADTPGPFRALIEHFAATTGLPMVLNTSLNLRGMPIVEHPEDALDCLYATRMDRLFLGDLEIAAPDLTAALPLPVAARCGKMIGVHTAYGNAPGRIAVAADGRRVLEMADGARPLHEIAAEAGIDADVAVDVCLELRRRGLLQWSGVPQTPRMPDVLVQYMPDLGAQS
jgi:carbamoyltransferase